jgi:hypothetical protein
MIFCFNGDSFSPPQILRIGDKVKVQGESYALFSFASGFAGNSYGFAVVDEFDYRFLPYEDKRAFRKKCVSITRTFVKKRDSVFALVNALRDECVFHEMRLDEFDENKRCTEKANSLLASLFEFMSANKRYVVDYLAQVKAITEATEKTECSLREIKRFESLYFGPPM